MKLAPSWDLLNKLKANVKEDIPLAIELYKDTYKKETLDKLNQDEVLNNLMIFSKGEDIVLLCYEAPDKFCHRHLVASWFEEVGIHVKELIN
jgi:uncharacterized protein (DUF488 family)